MKWSALLQQGGFRSLVGQNEVDAKVLKKMSNFRLRGLYFMCTSYIFVPNMFNESIDQLISQQTHKPVDTDVR